MSNECILLILSDLEAGQLLERAALTPAGYQVTFISQWEHIEKALQDLSPDLIILGEKIGGHGCVELGGMILSRLPLVPILLLPETHSDSLALEVFRQGFSDYLQPPLRTNDVLSAVNRALQRRRKWEERVRLESSQEAQSLRHPVAGMEAVEKIGRQAIAFLDLESILTCVVNAAVELTGAEEGSLLLLDEHSAELYMRASRNFQENFVNTFRMPIRDTLAGQVLKSGKPLLIDDKTLRKDETSVPAYTIIYFPLMAQERVFGILEVDNRQSKKPLSDDHIAMIAALADYAAIALENARKYLHSEAERNKLETILEEIEEGVIVVDQDRRIVMINRKACESFDVEDKLLVGKRIREVIDHPDLLDVLRDKDQTAPSRIEIAMEDGRVFNAQLTPIPEIGLVITMQEITHLKELDRIKSDFVSTVSHDLRSPLTAILGYIELIDRVGPVNEQQKEFIRRVQISVNSITALINDLLDLGRIEAGFDIRKEIVPLSPIIHYAIDGLRGRAADKSLEMKVEIGDELPRVLGNPVRLRQMASNLISNAIKYTPAGGKVSVRMHNEDGQVILQVTDNGPGIPVSDQPYIFDKFYRASNVPAESSGTGLGLAIVKSIVENHQGRIWVDSALGQGSTFTVVLPMASDPL